MEIKIKKIDDYRWLIPKTGHMRVPGLVFSSDELIKDVKQDQSLVLFFDRINLLSFRIYKLVELNTLNNNNEFLLTRYL